ncbi:hypothetical protein SGRIM128S_09344 [Streptomyces griseomycini]
MDPGLGEGGGGLGPVPLHRRAGVGDLRAQHRERPAPVHAVQPGGQRGLPRAPRRPDLVEGDGERHVHGLVEQGHVEPGAQHGGAGAAVLLGGVRGTGADQRGGACGEGGGRGDGDQTACGHAEGGAVQGGGTPGRHVWDPERMSARGAGRQRSGSSSPLRGGLADPFDSRGTAVPRRHSRVPRRPGAPTRPRARSAPPGADPSAPVRPRAGRTRRPPGPPGRLPPARGVPATRGPPRCRPRGPRRAGGRP